MKIFFSFVQNIRWEWKQNDCGSDDCVGVTSYTSDRSKSEPAAKIGWWTCCTSRWKWSICLSFGCLDDRRRDATRLIEKCGPPDMQQWLKICFAIPIWLVITTSDESQLLKDNCVIFSSVSHFERFIIYCWRKVVQNYIHFWFGE